MWRPSAAAAAAATAAATVGSWQAPARSVQLGDLPLTTGSLPASRTNRPTGAAVSAAALDRLRRLHRRPSFLPASAALVHCNPMFAFASEDSEGQQGSAATLVVRTSSDNGAGVRCGAQRSSYGPVPPRSQQLYLSRSRTRSIVEPPQHEATAPAGGEGELGGWRSSQDARSTVQRYPASTAAAGSYWESQQQGGLGS